MTTVPRETLVQVVESYNQLLDLKVKQAALMAEMIRGCISTLQCDPKDTRAYRMAQGFSAEAKATKEHRENQKKAWLYLQHVATMLEDMSGRPDVSVKGTEDVHGCEKPS